MSVRMDRVSKVYGLLWALREVRLELTAGEWVALLGPNGAGKTTLLRLLAALAYPTAGAIELFGRTLPYGNSPLRGMIGFLSSGSHLYDNLTVGENLRFFVSLYRTDATAQGAGRGPERGGGCTRRPANTSRRCPWACAAAWPSPSGGC